MKFVIQHDRWQALKVQTDPFSFLPRFIFLFCLPRSYWQTTLTDAGIRSVRPFGFEVHIPWSQINLVDVSGLKEPAEDTLNFFEHHISKRSALHLKNRRAFTVRLNDHKLVRSVSRFMPGKITFCAADAISVENISVAEAHQLKEQLNRICQEKEIKQDILVFDWPE